MLLSGYHVVVIPSDILSAGRLYWAKLMRASGSFVSGLDESLGNKTSPLGTSVFLYNMVHALVSVITHSLLG